ncbi:hypothetical protein HK405_015039, partial [Cladochytrium tenue]
MRFQATITAVNAARRRLARAVSTLPRPAAATAATPSSQAPPSSARPSRPSPHPIPGWLPSASAGNAAAGATPSAEPLVHAPPAPDAASLLLVCLPASAALLARPDCVVGMSSSVSTRTSAALPTPAAALRRAATAGPALLRLQLLAANAAATGAPGQIDDGAQTAPAADLLFAPPRAHPRAALAAIALPAGSELRCRPNAWVAASTDLDCDVDADSAPGLPAFRVSGAGTLVLSSRAGALHRVVLAPREEYRVRAATLVAWDAALAPARDLQATAANPAAVSPLSPSPPSSPPKSAPPAAATTGLAAGARLAAALARGAAASLAHSADAAVALVRAVTRAMPLPASVHQ